MVLDKMAAILFKTEHHWKTVHHKIPQRGLPLEFRMHLVFQPPQCKSFYLKVKFDFRSRSDHVILNLISGPDQIMLSKIWFQVPAGIFIPSLCMGAIIGRMVGIGVEQFVFYYNDVMPAFLQVRLFFFIMWSPLARRHLLNHFLWLVFESSLHITFNY